MSTSSRCDVSVHFFRELRSRALAVSASCSDSSEHGPFALWQALVASIPVAAARGVRRFIASPPPVHSSSLRLLEHSFTNDKAFTCAVNVGTTANFPVNVGRSCDQQTSILGLAAQRHLDNYKNKSREPSLMNLQETYEPILAS